MKLRALLLALMVSVAASNAHATESLILISANNTLSASELAMLKAKLESTINLNVRTQERSVSYQTVSTFDPSREQYDSDALLTMDKLFGEAYANYSVTFISDDIYSGPYHYVFANMHNARTLISTRHLKPNLLRSLLDSTLFVERLYKLILRSVGAMHSVKSDCGLMGYVNNGAELDAKPYTYCDADAVLLRSFGVLK